jgi:predicted DNA repair protein MutK
MAGSSLLALIDDISTLLDDVAVLSKVAVKKTSGVVGDDLALNAEQVTGFAADRELPVVWAVAKGSFVNKLILVPSALLISAFAPRLVIPLLMIGGIFLCYEGFEKVAHKLLHAKEDAAHKAKLSEALVNVEVDLVALEQERIKGAIRTDFILSAEIVVIALGTMATQPMLRQIVALSVIGILITVLVYGLVAGIVKLDDLGLRLHGAGGPFKPFGAMILRLAPVLMRTLGVVGTAAMFMVGGSIIVHGIPALEHVVEDAVRAVASGGIVAMLTRTVLDAFVGVVAGGLVVAVVSVPKLFKRGEPTLPAAP